MGAICNGWKGLHWSLKTGSILVCLYALYIVAGFFLLPPLAGTLLEDTLAGQLNRRVSIENIRFNPLLLHAQISEVTVYGTDNATVDLSLGSLDVDVQFASVFQRALVIKELTLDRPYAFVRILNNKGGSNLADLFAKGGPQPAAASKSSQKTSVFPVIVKSIFCTNGTVRIKDDPKSSTHLVNGINLTVPFFSSRLSDREKEVTPLLAFRLNDTPFELTGRSVPFAPGRRTEFDLKGSGLDLTRFWSYVPIGPSLSLSAGLFTSTASLVFEQTPQGKRPFSIFLKGEFELNNVKLTHAKDGQILTCTRARAVLTRFRLLPREALFSKIIFEDPFVSLERRKDGTLNWSYYIHEIHSEPMPAPADPASETSVSLRFVADSIRLNNGRITIRDQVPDSGFATTLGPVTLRVDHLDTAKNATAAMTATIPTSHGETLGITASMSIDPFVCNGTFALENATIPTYFPYFTPFFPLDLIRGTLACSAGFMVAAGENPVVRFSEIRGRVEDVALCKTGSSRESIGFASFAFEGGGVDLVEHRIGFAGLVLTEPRLVLERDKKGVIDPVSLFVPPEKKNSVPPPASEETSHSFPWAVHVDSVACVDGDVRFTDRAVRTIAVNRLQDIDLTLTGVDSDRNRPLTFTFAARLNGSGTIRSSGMVVPATLATQGILQASRLELSALNPYVPASVRLDVRAGQLDLAGKWDLRTKTELSGNISGNVDVTGVSLKERPDEKDIFGLKSLRLEGIALHFAPNTLHMDRVVVAEPGIFLEKDEQGVLNLVRVMGEDTAKKPAAFQDNEEKKDARPAFFKDIQVDSVLIEQGGVAFLDRSLSPDFTASLDRINARVTTLSLDPATKANLDLNATLNNHAPLSLQGDLSPLRRPVASDLVFRLAHMDMTSLTPYTQKSLAYPVLKGKLNWNGRFMTENYVLKASNTFFVEQFELGEKVDSPDAVSVPIKLGLALLQDTDGNLQLDVPVQGQLDDPKFRLGGVIFKAIIGIFSKIATAPFALIGSMFGGGNDLSYLDYAAGSFEPSPPTLAKLDAVTTALQKRPGIRVFVTGLAEKAADQKGLEDAAFMRKIRLQKYNALEEEGDAPKEGVDAVVIAPDTYEEDLFLAYKAEPGKKPRRFGLVQKLPVEEMERVVRQDIIVSSDDLLELANRRSRTVRQYLLEKGKITADRVFVTSSKVVSASGKVTGMRVDLSLGK